MASHTPVRVEAEQHVAIRAEAVLVREEEQRQGIAVAAVELAVHPGEYRRLPQAEPETVAQPDAQPVGEEVAMDRRAERVLLVEQRARQSL